MDLGKESVQHLIAKKVVSGKEDGREKVEDEESPRKLLGFGSEAAAQEGGGPTLPRQKME